MKENQEKDIEVFIPFRGISLSLLDKQCISKNKFEKNYGCEDCDFKTFVDLISEISNEYKLKVFNNNNDLILGKQEKEIDITDKLIDEIYSLLNNIVSDKQVFAKILKENIKLYS